MKQFLGFCAMAMLIVGCGWFQPVEVTEIVGFDNLRMTSGILQGSLQLRVYNPNPYALHAISSEVDVFIDGELSGHCTLAEPVRIPGDASSDVVLDIISEEKALGSLLKSGLKGLLGGASVVKARGVVTGKQWWIMSEIPLEYTDTLRLQ